jgi:hypothetical protein
MGTDRIFRAQAEAQLDRIARTEGIEIQDRLSSSQAEFLEPATL